MKVGLNALMYRVTPKKTEPIYFCLKFINFILALTFLMTSGSSKMGRPPPHTHTDTQTSNHTLDWLREPFQERLISRKCDVEWAPHSPNLNPPDFYLWGYLKDNAYQNNPQTIGELKDAIAEKIREIPRQEGVRVIFAQRMLVCLER